MRFSGELSISCVRGAGSPILGLVLSLLSASLIEFGDSSVFELEVHRVRARGRENEIGIMVLYVGSCTLSVLDACKSYGLT